MPTPPRINIIILAAGASTRFGAPKQLIRYQGTTLLRRTVETALRSKGHAVHVVVGFDAEKMHMEIADLPVHVVVNPHWQDGISTSLRSGIQSLGLDIDAAIIVLCDQVMVTSSLIDSLLDSYKKSHRLIIACHYGNTVGVPALFDRRLFNKLENLQGDVGAKHIIEYYASERMDVDFPDGVYDIDSMKDIENLG